MNSIRTLLAIAATMLGLLCFACAPDSPTESATDKASTESEPAAELWNVKLAGFRDWPIAPGTSAKMEGRGWHSALATVRMNEKALSAVNDDAERMPQGAIMVKENFDADGRPVNIVVMERLEDNWYWAQFELDGNVDMAGQSLNKCVSCHGMAPNDNVFTWKRASSPQH